MTTHVEITPEAAIRVSGPSFHDGEVEAAMFMGGEFSVDLDDILSRTTARVFVLRSIGLTLEEARQKMNFADLGNAQYHCNKVIDAFEVSNLPHAIHTAFTLGLYDVTKPLERASLTPRQEAVIQSLAEGMTRQEIAESRNRSITTIRSQIVDARSHLGRVPSMLAAVTYAHLSGNLGPDPEQRAASRS